MTTEETTLSVPTGIKPIDICLGDLQADIDDLMDRVKQLELRVSELEEVKI